MSVDIDSECVALAAHFLQDYEHASTRDRQFLAQAIQIAVEDWLADFEREPPEPDGEAFRGGESAPFEAEQQARIQRELK